MSILGETLTFDYDIQKDIYGIISVTYPDGTYCSLTNGHETFEAPNTNGQAIFLVETPDMWTASYSEDGENAIITKEVAINEYGQIKYVDLTIDPILNNNSWDTISQVALAGTGDDYWDLGDCKEIVLNGKVGDYLTLENYSTYVFILDFNHPIKKTIADNNIIFGGFKTALTGGKDIALCDSGYNSSYSTGATYFNFNHYGSSGGNYSTNYGGWKGCDLRYDILGATSTKPSIYGTAYKTTANTGYNAINYTLQNPIADTLLKAFPKDLRNVMRLWNRYIDFKGNKSNTDANCKTATVDAISLLAEFEIFGTRTYANNYEQNYQKQMQYYTAGNSKVKYKHNATTTAVNWWESSAYYGGANGFCIVNTSGSASSNSSHYSRGLAPAFKV